MFANMFPLFLVEIHVSIFMFLMLHYDKIIDFYLIISSVVRIEVLIFRYEYDS